MTRERELQDQVNRMGDQLSADWMTGGARTAVSLIPPYDWGDMDPNKAGDPILVVEGRGAFVLK